MLRKNTASQILCFAGVNATTGAALTGASWTGRKCLDGTFSSLTATVTEDTGTGFYKVALAQGDTNANDLAYFFTATNAVPVCINALTTAADPSDTVRFGLTALPNVASGSAGAIVTAGTGTAQISTSSGQVTVATNNDKTGYSLTQTFPSNFSALSITAGGVAKADLDTIKTQTVTCAGGVTIPAATLASTTNITAGTITTVTNLTNAPTSGDLTATMKASVNAEVDSALDTAIPGTPTANSVNERILTMDNNLPSDPADASDIATSFSGVTSTLSSIISTLATIASYIDTEVAAIKAKTDNLPASPANEATLTTIASYIDTEVAAIKAKTDNLPSDPADASDIAAAFATLTTDVTDLETAVTNLANSTVQLDATGELAFQAFYAANTASTSIDDVIDAIGTGGGGGDPWTTSLPGTYTAGQAGYILGHNLDAQISGIGGATGPGADTVTITIKVASVAVANAQVWISSDSGGSNVIAGTKLTNSQGEVVFLLDAGTTYYLWMQKDGVEPILGQSFVGVADT